MFDGQLTCPSRINVVSVGSAFKDMRKVMVSSPTETIKKKSSSEGSSSGS